MKDTHQELMYVVYARWKRYGDALDIIVQESEGINRRGLRELYWGFEGLLEKVPEPQAIACILGKLNQQVTNGGWFQWADNDYMGPSWPWIESNLAQIGPLSAQVWAIAQRFKARYDDYVFESEEFEAADACGYCNEDCELCDSDNVEIPVWIEGQENTEFDVINEQWMGEVLGHLQMCLAEETVCQLCGKPDVGYALLDFDGQRWPLCQEHHARLALILGHWVSDHPNVLHVGSIDFTWEDWA